MAARFPWHSPQTWLMPEPEFRRHVECRMACYDPDLFANDDDAALLARVAREMFDLYGAQAVRRLRDQACIAAGIGDSLSVRSWLDIAEAVQDLLLEQAVATLPSPA